MEWGDPDTVAPLKFIRDRYVLRYVNSDCVALEIGPGGGRWTRYLLPSRKLYVVDYYQELLDELKKTYCEPNMVFVKNNGTDFPEVEDASVDHIYSFGTFVHLDVDLIDRYLENMSRIMRPGGNIVIQYSDKNKIMAQLDKTFVDNTPVKMRKLLVSRGYKILEEDLTTLWHSSIVRFTV